MDGTERFERRSYPLIVLFYKASLDGDIYGLQLRVKAIVVTWFSIDVLGNIGTSFDVRDGKKLHVKISASRYRMQVKKKLTRRSDAIYLAAV